MPATCVRLAYKVSCIVYKCKCREGKGQGREGEVGREKGAAGCGLVRTELGRLGAAR